VYALRRTHQDASYFIPQSRVNKIIVNMIDSDNGMRDTIIRVSRPGEAKSEGEHGAIPVVWNLSPIPRGGVLPTIDIEAKL